MKKLYTIVIILGFLIVFPMVMLAQSAGNNYVGYAKYDDQLWEYDGVMLNKDSKVGCAILITKDMIAPYAGGTIKGMRVGWGTTQMTGEYEGFVRNDFNGEDLSTGKATVRYSYSDSNPGWNTMTMTDYVIPDDVEQLVVGFTTNVKSGVYAIPTLYPHNTNNSCYLWVDGDNDEEGNPRWVDHNEYGILPILLIIEDTEGTSSLLPVLTSLTPNGVVTAGEPSDCLMQLKNAGSETIRSIEVTSRQGQRSYSKKVTLSKTIASSQTSDSFMVPLMCFESGDVELSITKVNDKELTKPVAETVNLLAVPKEVAEKYSRRPLMEYYESENNYRSARYYDEYIAPQIEPVRNDITIVCQHMDDQFVTGNDDAAALTLKLCDNESSQVSIPAMTVDRAMNTGNILVQMNQTKTPLFDILVDQTYFNQMLNSAKNVPTFAGVKANGSVNGSILNVVVDSWYDAGVLPNGETPRLTVYLMERNVFSNKQMLWSGNESEAHAGEYTHANVIRKILADAVKLPATGSYTWETTVNNPDPTWNNDNLYIVAFVHRDGQKGGKYMHVFNSTESDFEASSSGIEVNATNFPDAIFRNWVLSNISGASDGVLTDEEIANIKSINCQGNNIQSLKGIELFTSLITLSCGWNQLISLDVSGCFSLTELSCDNNKLTSLDISNCNALTELNCSYNKLTSLNVSGCKALTHLYCHDNQLVTLDVSNNIALSNFECNENKLTKLDVSKNTALIRLNCSSNQLTTLDISNKQSLYSLECFSNLLESIDVSGCSALMEFTCNGNKLTKLNVSSCSALAVLISCNNQLMCLDLSNNDLRTAQLSPQELSITTVDTDWGIAIPVPSGFDISKVSNLELNRESVSGSILTINGQKYLVFAQTGTSASSINGKQLTYTYSTDNSFSDAASMDVTVTLSYTSSTYTLSIQSGSGGYVSYNGTTISNTTKSFSVESGSSATITITPNSGYRLSRLAVNSVDRTSYVSNNQYTISNITANTTVVVTFEQIPVTTYTLSIQSGSGGSVSYDGTTISNTIKSFSVTAGSSATITITPNSGYRLSKLTVNGTDRTSYVSNNKYTISNISADTNVLITFEQIPATTYTLSIQSGRGGSVSYNGTTISNTTKSFSVESGSSATITITPNSGYRLSRLAVNSVDRTSSVSNNKYTISNITANTTVAVTFEQIPVTTYTLSIQSGSGGSVSYDGTTISNTTKSFSVESGSSATITITPNSGYRLSRLAVNSVDRTSSVSNNKYTISNITANTTVAVTFEQIPVTTYTLSIQSGSGGTVSYNGTTISNATKSFSVESGSSATITITPNSGYRLSRLVVNSTDRTSNVSNNKYTISNITANTTVAVTFEQIPVTTYTLSIQSGSGGSVSYNGTTISNTTRSFSVESGSSATITITPNSGYRLSRLVVNSTDRTSNVSNNKYTISNITANTTVAVTFEQIPVTTYTLSIQSGSGGSVSYNGTTISNATKSFSVESGSSATISISPNTGYKLSKLTVNGTDRTSFVSNNQYTISNITANINLVVTYETITYTLSIQSGSGGSVSYNGTTISNTTKSFSVTHGSSATISITPNSGYRLSRLVVNSTDQTSKVSNNQYTVGNITANTTVAVTFEQIPIPTYTLTVTASGNGSATYNGTTVRKGSQSFSLEEGSSATIAFTPDEWHQLGSVKVNNTDVTSGIANNQYTVSNIKSNTTVTVTFTEIEYSSLTSEGVNYRVVSNPNKTVSVASGSYGYWLMVPATFTANGFEWSVTGIDKDVISGNPQLAAVIWNPAVQFSASVNNPNFLLYVTSSQYAPSSIKNVVVGNTANSITLTDASSGNNFYCPREFTAKQISYSHSYGMTTGINEARGWESVALPFDVEAITHTSKGNLVPFSRWQEGSNDKPFWLCELGSSGFVAASSIKANTPYIISMPNNAEYKDEYRVAGTITFSSTDVKVKSSESLQNGSYSDRTFVPNFINQNANSGFYVLNAVNNYSANSSGYAEGSRFVRNLRAIHPFEAYIASANNAKESFPIFEDTPTWIQLIENSKLIMDRVYNLSGQQVKIEGDQNYGSLKKGVYIVNGKKVVIK